MQKDASERWISDDGLWIFEAATDRWLARTPPMLPPSEVVVPTCRPAMTRMWVMSRVTVLLPFVPDTETIGMVRSTSRIHAGGEVPAASIAASTRARSRL